MKGTAPAVVLRRVDVPFQPSPLTPTRDLFFRLHQLAMQTMHLLYKYLIHSRRIRGNQPIPLRFGSEPKEI